MVTVSAPPRRTRAARRRLGVKVTATSTGKPWRSAIPTKTDDEGVVRLKFTLPKRRHQGSREHQRHVPRRRGNPKPIIRPIPIVGRIINVEFFPEGGDLIENVPNRVYFQATMPNGKPADLKGTITDGQEVVAEIATLTDAEQPGVNRGQGVFTFTPKPGQTYFLKVQKPAGIIEPVIENSVCRAKQPQGVGSVAGGVRNCSFRAHGFQRSEGQSRRRRTVGPRAVFERRSTDPRIAANGQDEENSRRRRLHSRRHDRSSAGRGRTGPAGRGQAEADNPVGGVDPSDRLRGEIGRRRHDRQAIPVAERLVYRKPVRELNLHVTPDRSNRYNPGSPVGLELSGHDRE